MYGLSANVVMIMTWQVKVYLDLQVVGEQVDPLGDPCAQGLLDGLGINLDVANSGTGRKGLNFLLCPSVLGNLSLKAV